MASTYEPDVCVVGGGPAGMMLAVLLGRHGLSVTVVEKHADFLRDFRGDTIHASTLALMDELGWGDEFLRLPHQKIRRLSGVFGGEPYTVADCTRLPGRHRYIALMPQWDFLDFLADKAAESPGFTLLRSTEVDGLRREEGRVVGVSGRGPDGRVEVRARLTVACDGRHSDVRRLLGMRPRQFGAPMDVLWFRLPRRSTDPDGLAFIVGSGVALVLIDRGDYFQVAYVIPKGGYDRVRAAGLDKLVDQVGKLAPSLAERTDALESWDDVHVLTVVIDRLRRWHRPGVLLIGDAAHAMSPMGGVGVNLAVQDAVAAARILAPHLRAARDGGVIPGAMFKSLESQLARVQARRLFPTVATQLLQRVLGRGVIARVLQSDRPLPVPLFIRAAQRLPILQGLTARAIALGFRPEHVRRASRHSLSPSATQLGMQLGPEAEIGGHSRRRRARLRLQGGPEADAAEQAHSGGRGHVEVGSRVTPGRPRTAARGARGMALRCTARKPAGGEAATPAEGVGVPAGAATGRVCDRDGRFLARADLGIIEWKVLLEYDRDLRPSNTSLRDRLERFRPPESPTAAA